MVDTDDHRTVAMTGTGHRQPAARRHRHGERRPDSDRAPARARAPRRRVRPRARSRRRARDRRPRHRRVARPPRRRRRRRRGHRADPRGGRAAPVRLGRRSASAGWCWRSRGRLARKRLRLRLQGGGRRRRHRRGWPSSRARVVWAGRRYLPALLAPPPPPPKPVLPVPLPNQAAPEPAKPPTKKKSCRTRTHGPAPAAATPAGETGGAAATSRCPPPITAPAPASRWIAAKRQIDLLDRRLELGQARAILLQHLGRRAADEVRIGELLRQVVAILDQLDAVLLQLGLLGPRIDDPLERDDHLDVPRHRHRGLADDVLARGVGARPPHAHLAGAGVLGDDPLVPLEDRLLVVVGHRQQHLEARRGRDVAARRGCRARRR